IVRGADARLRALSNVCRHRAGPIAAGEGSCQAFRCGYHGWSYALDGRLVNTPEFDGVENFHKEEQSLPEFRLQSWLGLLFVNLDPSAPPFIETLEDLPERLASRGLESMRPATRKSWIVGCDWKVYVDNYLEGYHIPIVHPSLMKELDYARYVTETKRCYSLQHSPIRESGPGRLKRSSADDEALYFWMYPNLMLNVYPDNFSTNLILPLPAGQRVAGFRWFLRHPQNAGGPERHPPPRRVPRRDSAPGHRHLRGRAEGPRLPRLRPRPLLGPPRERRPPLPLALRPRNER